jgi:hypothetical protein
VSRRTFATGMVIVVVSIIAIGFGIHALNGTRQRPEGAAEHWLAAVGDTTRKGVRTESVDRAEDFGPVSLAQPLLDEAGDTDGKRAFTDLEVGRADVGADGLTRVPYRLHVFDVDDPKDGAVVLQRKTGSHDWRVVALDARAPTEKVPSEGGDPPSRAPAWTWVLALAFGVVLIALCSAAVRLASPHP